MARCKTKENSLSKENSKYCEQYQVKKIAINSNNIIVEYPNQSCSKAWQKTDQKILEIQELSPTIRKMEAFIKIDKLIKNDGNLHHEGLKASQLFNYIFSVKFFGLWAAYVWWFFWKLIKVKEN